mmetsp:Transcript_14744/g.35989  ORF Transcript_14744/g.35989 Transcript_14744/m.35989 type:complete len:285 (-) Transcript_14744:837-1691(-)
MTTSSITTTAKILKDLSPDKTTRTSMWTTLTKAILMRTMLIWISGWTATVIIRLNIMIHVINSSLPVLVIIISLLITSSLTACSIASTSTAALFTLSTNPMNNPSTDATNGSTTTTTMTMQKRESPEAVVEAAIVRRSPRQKGTRRRRTIRSPPNADRRSSRRSLSGWELGGRSSRTRGVRRITGWRGKTWSGIKEKMLGRRRSTRRLSRWLRRKPGDKSKRIRRRKGRSANGRGCTRPHPRTMIEMMSVTTVAIARGNPNIGMEKRTMMVEVRRRALKASGTI